MCNCHNLNCICARFACNNNNNFNYVGSILDRYNLSQTKLSRQPKLIFHYGHKQWKAYSWHKSVRVFQFSTLLGLDYVLEDFGFLLKLPMHT